MMPEKVLSHKRHGSWDDNVVFKAHISVFTWLGWELPFGIQEDESWEDNPRFKMPGWIVWT